MAGIGFVLRKLSSRGDLTGLAQAYLHASVSSTGGWLFTIATLALISFLGPWFATWDDLTTFRLVIVYNFAFSLVLTGPITMVLTRYLADMIFARTVEGVPGVLVGGLAVALGTTMVPVSAFYLWYLDLPGDAKLAACVGFGLLAGIWVVSVFLSTLKEYAAVTRAFGVGMVVALAAAYLAGPDAGVGGMLAGFDIGLACILFALVGRVLAEFPFPVARPFAFVPYFRTHWPLAASGGVYYLGIWVDKWLMWTAPERTVIPAGLVSYPAYDSALFLACLAIVPSMAVFVVNIETRFFEQYHRFYRDIGAHATLTRILDNQTQLLEAVFHGARQLVLPQIAFTVALVALAPTLLTALSIPYGQLGMFRIAVIGALFQLFFLLLTIVLSYLDLNRLTLALHALFLVLNAAGTALAIHLGFPFYGYGYFVAAVVVFVVACVAAFRCLDDLPYHTFVTGNASIRPRPAGETVR